MNIHTNRILFLGQLLLRGDNTDTSRMNITICRIRDCTTTLLDVTRLLQRVFATAATRSCYKIRATRCRYKLATELAL